MFVTSEIQDFGLKLPRVFEPGESGLRRTLVGSLVVCASNGVGKPVKSFACNLGNGRRITKTEEKTSQLSRNTRVKTALYNVVFNPFGGVVIGKVVAHSKRLLTKEESETNINLTIIETQLKKANEVLRDLANVQQRSHA
jgi:hypothetical protein